MQLHQGKNYAELLRYKLIEERKPVQIDVNDDSSYNEAITENAYNVALNSAKESAPGHSRITYSMLKHFYPEATKIIMKLYNRIFPQHSFPTTWKTSVVIPIPKPNKDPSGFRRQTL